MKVDLKKWVRDNLIGKTGKIISLKMKKEWFIKKGLKEIYNLVYNRTQYLQEASLLERIFHIINDLDEIQTCKKLGCFNKVKFYGYQYGYNYFCSISCSSNSLERKEKIKKIYQKKYGVDHMFQSEEIKDKIKKTNIEKYGHEYPSQSDVVKEKTRKTNTKKYGFKGPLSNPILREKYRITSIKNFGCNHPSQSQKVQLKRKKTCLKKYGTENPLQSLEIRKKADISVFEKYGTKHSSQSNIIKRKIRNSMFKKYGVKWPIQKNILKSSFSKLNDKKWMNESYKTKSGEKIAFELGVSPRTVFEYLRFHNISVTGHRNSSSLEKELSLFLCEEKIITNTRSIIDSNEIDLYLLKYKIGIEFDGLFWHSSYDDESDYKIKNKHLNKTNLCRDKGIQLFHIFENEWLNENKRDIWKSIIGSKLGKNDKIYARKCIIREISDNSLIREFLENNHLQGFVGSSIKLGLFYNDELISLMIFGKIRYSKKYEWEMIRFCNKKYLNVVGGASKLFKYFIRNYNPKTIVSYADKRHSGGQLYKTLGFEHSHDSAPNYFYFKHGNIILYPRVKFQKHKLEKKLENFDLNLSESKNMFNNGYRKIWDCGNMIYVWKNQ